MMYFKLGPKADYFIDIVTGTEIHPGEVIALESQPNSHNFARALAAGGVSLASVVDYNNYVESQNKSVGEVEKTKEVIPDISTGEDDEEDVAPPKESKFEFPTMNTAEEITKCIEPIETIEELIAWAEEFGFDKKDKKAIKTIVDISELKTKITELGIEYTV